MAVAAAPSLASGPHAVNEKIPPPTHGPLQWKRSRHTGLLPVGRDGVFVAALFCITYAHGLHAIAATGTASASLGTGLLQLAAVATVRAPPVQRKAHALPREQHQAKPTLGAHTHTQQALDRQRRILRRLDAPLATSSSQASQTR